MANSANGDLGFSSMQKRYCFSFVRYGICSYGRSCKYTHPTPQKSAVVREGMSEAMYADYTRRTPCKFFRAGFCMYGTNCNFHHSLPDPPLQYNSDGLPMRMSKQLCSFYMHKLWCGYGVGCKFHHPELYLVPGHEYGSHASGQGQAQEYDVGLLDQLVEDIYYPLSDTNSPQLLSNYAYNGNP